MSFSINFRFGSPARVLAADVFRLLLPSSCLVCGDRVVGRLPLCPPCAMRLSPVEAHDARRAAQDLVAVDDLTVLWMLDPGGPARALVHGLKYRGLRGIGTETGRMLGRRLREGSAEGCDAVVPVPLHGTRRLERGYNQAEQIARGVAERLGAPVSPEAVLRRNPGRSQTRSGRAARSEAVRSAFSVVHPGMVAGKRLVLVDDVLTTGATASAVARALRDAGAVRVHLATVGLTRRA